jgi:lysozyme family protein
VPSGYELERAVSAWQQLREHLISDEELVHDEGVIASALAAAQVDDPRDLLARMIDAVVWTERRAEEAKAIADEFTERRRRYESRAVNMREIVHTLMDAIPVDKYQAKLARASIVDGAASARITDETKIPDEYFKTERTLRKSDVLADLRVGVVIEGAELSNGGPTLRIARVR